MATEVTKKKMPWTYWLHLAIGMCLMFIVPRLGPWEPITEVGMTVLGVFIGMVYLWSALDSIWPSLLGLLIISISGFVPELKGYAAVKQPHTCPAYPIKNEVIQHIGQDLIRISCQQMDKQAA